MFVEVLSRRAIINFLGNFMVQWHGGKGSTSRKVDKKKFNENWDKIFGKKDDVLDSYNDERLVSKYDKKYNFFNTIRGPIIVDGKLNPENPAHQKILVDKKENNK